MSNRIDLAHEAAFALDALTVRPSTREIVRADGGVEVVEPRVMQVLVALARAQGAILSRDDLTRCCWDDRVVGEDAINRVISRLRRLAETSGGAFRIETVTKVGYRLTRPDGETPPPTPVEAPAGRPASALPPRSRRWIIGGGAAGAVALGLGGVAWWRPWRRSSAQDRSPQVAALFDQGMTALRLTSNEGNQQARGLFARATELAPDDADCWGALAVAYAVQSHTGPPSTVAASDAHARSAIARARGIDPGNAWAQAAIGYLLPRRGHWAEQERAFGAAARRLPANDVVAVSYSGVYAACGRFAAAAAILQPLFEAGPPSSTVHYSLGLWLWGAGRLDEADRVIDQGLDLYPLNFAIWFLRFYVDCHSGRGARALTLAEDRDSLPSGVPAEEITRVSRFARAMMTRDPALIDSVIEESLGWARQGAGYAENAMQFASALGRVDVAFMVAEALYFERGFRVPAVRFTRNRGYYSYLQDRRTFWLFMPSTAAMRRDARFAPLLSELGLERYWRESGTVPDYRRG